MLPSPSGQAIEEALLLMMMIIYLTAIGLTPGGSSTYLHTNNA
jgi:hypothetical protein